MLMYTVILMGGRQLDALILSASPDRLRLAIPDRADTAELRLIDGRWTSESGAEVELAAILRTNSAELPAFAGFAETSVGAAI